MTPEKIVSVAEHYAEVLREAGAEAQRMDLSVPLDVWSFDQDINHLLNTACGIPKYIRLGKIGKANRHLGWLQRGVGMRFSHSLEYGMHTNKPQ